jgi:hypothetical protein
MGAAFRFASAPIRTALAAARIASRPIQPFGFDRT